MICGEGGTRKKRGAYVGDLLLKTLPTCMCLGHAQQAGWQTKPAAAHAAHEYAAFIICRLRTHPPACPHQQGEAQPAAAAVVLNRHAHDRSRNLRAAVSNIRRWSTAGPARCCHTAMDGEAAPAAGA